MKVQDLLDELSVFDADADVYIEVNGTAHDICSVTDDSQGVYIVIDEAVEERGMR